MTTAAVCLAPALAMLLSLLWVPPAHACTCAPSEGEEARSAAFDGANAVFEGQVVAIEEPDADEGVVRGGETFRQVTLHVVRTWKGANAERVVVRTRASTAACGYPFAQGRSYLVYTRAGTEAPDLVNLCSRTRPIEEAEADLAAMGAGVTPVNPEASAQEIEATAMPEPPPGGGGCASCAVVPGSGSGSGSGSGPALGFVSLYGLLMACRRLRRRS